MNINIRKVENGFVLEYYLPGNNFGGPSESKTFVSPNFMGVLNFLIELFPIE